MCSSCGSYNQYCSHQQEANAGFSSSVYWSSGNSHYYDEDHDTQNYSFSSVDCTLSLGTPSTRFSTSDQNHVNYFQNNSSSHSKPTPHRNSVSSFCWDLFHSTKQSSSSSKSHRHHSNATTTSGADQLLSRRCANCDTTSTPLWRNGPRGPKSLCNACGIRYKKEERRVAAASSTAAQNAGMMMVDPHNGASWAHQYPPQGTTPHQKMQTQCFGAPNNQEFRFIEDDRGGADGGVQFLSWLTYDRPAGLVHDFTR